MGHFSFLSTLIGLFKSQCGALTETTFSLFFPYKNCYLCAKSVEGMWQFSDTTRYQLLYMNSSLG